MDRRHLSQLLEEAVSRRPDHPAVEDESGRRQSYAELFLGSDRLATRLVRLGVEPGDRVGLWLPKSLEAVMAIHGILRSGASYVPVDATGPASRAAKILAASGVRAVVVAAELAPALRDAWPDGAVPPRLIVVEGLPARAQSGHQRSQPHRQSAAIAGGTRSSPIWPPRRPFARRGQ